MQKAGDSLHDFAQPAVPLAILSGNLAILRGEEFYSLCERFVPLGQMFDSFVYRHAI